MQAYVNRTLSVCKFYLLDVNDWFLFLKLLNENLKSFDIINVPLTRIISVKIRIAKGRRKDEGILSLIRLFLSPLNRGRDRTSYLEQILIHKIVEKPGH